MSGRGMAGVADTQPPRWLKERTDNSGRKYGLPGKFSELEVEQADEFCLIETVHEPPHEQSQVGCRRGYGATMPCYIRKQQPSDPACSTTGRIVYVATPLCLPVRFAVYPGVQPSEFHATFSKLAAAPHFHTTHLLPRFIVHSTPSYKPRIFT